jgi:2-oxoglutarate ferredoxin oxidoreductase subunit delta
LGTESKELVLNIAWCKGCGICAAFCPRKVLEIKHEKVVIANPEACVKCALCELRCPDYAIYVKEVQK